MTPKTDPLDERDLEILERYAKHQSPPPIAREMEIDAGIVDYVLLRDRAAFPNEPLR